MGSLRRMPILVGIACCEIACADDPSRALPDAAADAATDARIDAFECPNDATLTIALSKFPRGSETFVALTSGDHLPIIDGFQGFHVAELQLRVPDTVAAAFIPFHVEYILDGVDGGTVEEALTAYFDEAPDGGVRDSRRLVIYFNQFTDDQLAARRCHLNALARDGCSFGTIDLELTLDHSPCIDTGTTVVCPDGGTP